MLDILEFIAVVAAGTYGILKARTKRMDLIGVFTIAFNSFLAARLSDYLAYRQSLGFSINPVKDIPPLPENEIIPYLLAGSRYGSLNPGRVRHVFGQAVKTIGIEHTRRVLGRTNFNAPTVHSLRHSFAVNTLLRIKSREGSPQQALPVLAAYMGHSAYKYTAKYLKMIDAEMTYLQMDLTHKRNIQEQFMRYSQSLLSLDPRLNVLIDWENRQDVLAWLDNL